MKKKLETIQEEIHNLGMVDNSVRGILEKSPCTYHRIYNYAKREKIWLPKLFNDLGLKLNRVDNLDSTQKLDIFMMEIFRYNNSDWSNIPVTHKNLIKKVISSLGISFSAFLKRYNMSDVGTRKYHSIDEIKQDLLSKGLINPTISQIRAIDGSTTIGNIEFFAKNNGMTMRDIWFALHVHYEENIVVCETGVKKDFVYHNNDEMKKDFSEKKLMGKTKREVWVYDNGRTYGRVMKYAKRCGIAIEEFWNLLEVKKSPNKKIEMDFSTLDQLKSFVKKRGLVGKSKKEIAISHPDIWFQIKKWARKEKSMSEIWDYIGITKSQGFYDIDDIVSQIRNLGYKTLKEIRSDWKFYKRITGFISRNDISILQVWEKAEIPYDNQKGGRPPKK